MLNWFMAAFVGNIVGFWLLAVVGGYVAAMGLLYARKVVRVKSDQSLNVELVYDMLSVAYVMVIVFAVTSWVLMIAYLGWAVIGLRGF